MLQVIAADDDIIRNEGFQGTLRNSDVLVKTLQEDEASGEGSQQIQNYYYTVVGGEVLPEGAQPIFIDSGEVMQGAIQGVHFQILGSNSVDSFGEINSKV